MTERTDARQQGYSERTDARQQNYTERQQNRQQYAGEYYGGGYHGGATITMMTGTTTIGTTAKSRPWRSARRPSAPWEATWRGRRLPKLRPSSTTRHRRAGERFGLGDEMPAYWISFEDAERFAVEVTRRARASGSLPTPWRFSLPTEAQWEYACRAGTTSAWAFGDRLDPDRANFSVTPPVRAADAVGGATPVGRYPANAWGLHDMHGNVWEWCRDWYHPTLPGGTDPDRSSVRGAPNRDGSYSRVRRGGAWIESSAFCRSASRLPYEPDRGSDHIGFRVFVVEA